MPQARFARMGIPRRKFYCYEFAFVGAKIEPDPWFYAQLFTNLSGQYHLPLFGYRRDHRQTIVFGFIKGKQRLVHRQANKDL